MDTVLHIILGLFLLTVFYGVIRISGVGKKKSLKNAALFSVLFLYLREVTQHQTKYFDSDFFSGWIPWAGEAVWSVGKQIETFVPIVIVTLMALTIYKIRNH